MSETETTTEATEAPAKGKKAKAPKAPKEPRRGIGAVIREAILAGATNDEAFEAAKREFPEASTTPATISWYRNQLRKQGHDVPTAAEIKKAKKGEAPASEATPADADPLG